MKEQKVKKSILKKVGIVSLCVLIYTILVVISFNVFKPQQYESTKIEKSRQLAEEIVYKGIKNFDMENVDITFFSNENDINLLINKGLIYTKYENIQLEISLEDMTIEFLTDNISFEFSNLTYKERIIKNLGLYHDINYKIVDGNLIDNFEYSQSDYLYTMFLSVPIVLILLLIFILSFILLVCIWIAKLIDKIMLRVYNKKQRKNTIK